MLLVCSLLAVVATGPVDLGPAGFVVHGIYGLDGHTVDEFFVKAENGNNDLPSFFDLMNASGSS